jgi:DNA-3-methyladenine glycosylase
MILDVDFYRREDVLRLARELLGKYLVSHFDGQRSAGRIVETEAYRGPEDRASHAFNNRRTPRTEVMFRAGGVAYVYLCYGVHHLFNVVTGGEGQPHAVLIRAIEPIENMPLMLARRDMARAERRLCAGPGLLTRALGITTSHSGLSLLEEKGPIRIETREPNLADEAIVAGPRIGVSYAGESATWPWRFGLKGSPWLSRPFM